MTATETRPVAGITEPGVYRMTAEEYHADPVAGGSLSSSGARKLLAPSCPAKFRYETDHPPATTKTFDIGSAAHKLVLGVGPEIVIVEAPDWRTKAAREQRDEAHENGQVPLLVDEYAEVAAMCQALKAHPVAAGLFDPSRGGHAEVALIWRDDRTGIMCRALLDWLPSSPAASGRKIIPDYKTARSAHPDEFGRSAGTYGYMTQAAWYLAGVRSLGLADDAAFIFVVQEKTAPYLVSIVELDDTAMRIGEIRRRRALDVYRHCTETNHWPAYAEGVALASLPKWIEIEEGEHL